MSISNQTRIKLTWAALSAVFLAVICWLTWDWATYLAEERFRAEASVESYERYAKVLIDRECEGLLPLAARDCVFEQVKIASEYRRAEQDLDAQQVMARFTRVMGYTAIAGLFLGAASIAVIYSTLSAMNQTNKIMREEQRPWIEVPQDILLFDQLSRMHRSTPENPISIMVKNRGKSPARNAFATFATFSTDTVLGNDVAKTIEKKAIEILPTFRKPESLIWPGDEDSIPILPLPYGYRTVGSGKLWSTMIICLYTYEGHVRYSWLSIQTKAPPSAVLKHQKLKI